VVDVARRQKENVLNASTLSLVLAERFAVIISAFPVLQMQSVKLLNFASKAVVLSQTAGKLKIVQLVKFAITINVVFVRAISNAVREKFVIKTSVEWVVRSMLIVILVNSVIQKTYDVRDVSKTVIV